MPVRKLYRPGQLEAVLNRCGGWMEEVCGRFGLPAAALRAVVRKEMGDMDLLDPVADAAVRFYWFRWRLRSMLCRHGLLKSPLPALRKGPLGKRDSSTGYGQIFAYVAIHAANYGVDRGLTDYGELGLPTDHRMDPQNPEDLCQMWYLLRRNWRVNLALSALNLLSCGEEQNGHADFQCCTPEELQLAFTRYNANSRTITQYGRDVYQLYLQELTSSPQ